MCIFVQTAFTYLDFRAHLDLDMGLDCGLKNKQIFRVYVYFDIIVSVTLPAYINAIGKIKIY